MTVKRDEICYNCGLQGHWFIDCTKACGRCGGDGHRTLDCEVLCLGGGYWERNGCEGRRMKMEDVDVVVAGGV